MKKQIFLKMIYDLISCGIWKRWPFRMMCGLQNISKSQCMWILIVLTISHHEISELLCQCRCRLIIELVISVIGISIFLAINSCRYDISCHSLVLYPLLFLLIFVYLSDFPFSVIVYVDANIVELAKLQLQQCVGGQQVQELYAMLVD